MRLSNENRGVANYTRSSKFKEAKPSEQGGRGCKLYKVVKSEKDDESCQSRKKIKVVKSVN